MLRSVPATSSRPVAFAGPCMIFVCDVRAERTFHAFLDALRRLMAGVHNVDSRSDGERWRALADAYSGRSEAAAIVVSCLTRCDVAAFVDRVHAAYEDARVVIVSDRSDPAFERDVRQHGIHYFLLLPADAGELHLLVGRV